MTKNQLLQIIDEEIQSAKRGIINEKITSESEQQIRAIIRNEIAAIFFTLFKRRNTWTK